MAKIYNPVGWEDGKIINPAIADLTTGIVTPAEVSGTTPVNAENLKHMDEAIKQLYDEGASSKDIYIGNDNPPEDTKIWINTGEISPMHSEVVNSLSGNETTKAPSVQAVNNKFKEISAYSTEEKVIGTWDDDNPRYRKCFLIKNSSQINENNIIGRISNIDLITNIFGTMNVAGYITPLNSVWNDANADLSVLVQVQISNGDIILNLKSTVPRYPIFIAIEYTKTTDSAKKTINEEPTSEEVTI